jgi:transcriptional regulator with XRE-family HTH domain
MGRRARASRRTPAQAAADRAADELAARLGRMLLDGRRRLAITQAAAAARAGLSPGTWSNLEHERDARVTLATWNRAALAVGGVLDAHIKGTSAAGLPRDSVHLRNQELLARTAAAGRWRTLPEEQIDREARTSRWADVLLHRRLAGFDEYGLIEIFDWFDDVGGSMRDWQRRLDALERYAIARMRDDMLPRTGGCWLLRATARNRRLVADHGSVFGARFAGVGTGHAWLQALTTTAPMPDRPALLWVSIDGTRLQPVRLGA